MFTGIVEGLGKVVSIQPVAAGQRLVLSAPGILDATTVGASVAVEGCCLTVAAMGPEGASFDVIPATLSRTTLGQLRPGERVNLERAMEIGGRLDGHLVQGHVDGVAIAREVRRTPDGGWLAIFAPLEAEQRLTDSMIVRGSVAIAGVSLTLATLDPPLFGVALIPTTREITTLGDQLRPGRQVNVELDVIARYVAHYLHQAGLGVSGGGITLESLRDQQLQDRGEGASGFR